jgi:transcriptional regulator with GAF, ATPase, and Fis domain
METWQELRARHVRELDDLIIAALRANDGVIAAAARQLNVTPLHLRKTISMRKLWEVYT